MKSIFSRQAAAVELHRPLLLSPKENISRYLFSKAGALSLRVLAGVSILAVVLIFSFIIFRSGHFLTTSGGDHAAEATGAAEHSLTFGEAISHFTSRLGEMFGSAAWYPEADQSEFGMLSLVYGSLLVSVGALLIATPLGIAAAVVLSDIVPFRVRQILKPIVELLAAIPSVAFGFFAIKVVAPWLQNTCGLSTGATALNAAVILALMAVPTIVSVAEDALMALGREMREASYALGSTRAEMLLKVVIPAAHNGIIAAVVLGMMRAIGETMVVWMAAGNAATVPHPWYDLEAVFGTFLQSVRTMTGTIAGDMGETAEGSIHRSALFSVGLILLIFSFGLNLLTESLASRFRRMTGHVHIEEPKGWRAVIQKGWCGFWSMLWYLPHQIFYWLGCLLSWPVRQLHGRVRNLYRRGFDKAFTGFACMSVLLLGAALLVVLGPIFWKGSEAVVFRETVEHRRFLMDEFHRGDEAELAKAIAATNQARKPVYETLDRFAWLSPDVLIRQAGQLDRQTRDQIDAKLASFGLDDDGDAAKYQDMSRASRRARRYFVKACKAEDNDSAVTQLDKAIALNAEGLLNGTPAAQVIAMAKRFKNNIHGIDLSWREKPLPQDASQTYAQAYRQIRSLITGDEGNGCILGPEVRQGIEHLPPEVRYGATHWSMAQFYNRQLQTAKVWVAQKGEDGQVLKNVQEDVSRAALFDNTPMTPLGDILGYVDKHLDEMMQPELTFYGGYFTDPSTAGHFLGGVGPELLGTLAITVISILIALPLGVIAAAYLVEAAKDNWATRLLRMCINTLAGVPSIVFGLFGLAMIITFVTGKPCVLAGSLTLALLILPVIIRASEEAIRSVPQSYREASLGLGASKLRCFVTVTLPASTPGILTGTILGMSRAAGETAPLLFTCAVATGGFMGANFLFEATPVLSYSSYDIAVGDRVAKMVPYNQYGMVATLIAIVFILNFSAIWFRGRVSRRLRGA